MSLVEQLLGGPQAAKPRGKEDLLALKTRLSMLSGQRDAKQFTFGAGVSQSQQQIPIICRNIDEAISALDTGLDPHGNPITRNQVTDGLKRLVSATRKPEFVALMTATLSSAGIRELGLAMDKLDSVADGISRASRPIDGLLVGLVPGFVGGLAFGVPFIVVNLLEKLFPTLESTLPTWLPCVTFPIAIVLNYLVLRITNMALVRRGLHGIGYAGEGAGRVALAIVGVVVGWVVSQGLWSCGSLMLH